MMVGLSDTVDRLLMLDERLATIEGRDRPQSNPAPRQSPTASTGNEMDDRLVDAKIEAAEARTDAKFAELKGLLASVPSRWDLWGGLLALFVGILGVLAFGSDRLALGVGLADQRQEQLERDRQQDATANEMNAKLDLLINRK